MGVRSGLAMAAASLLLAGAASAPASSYELMNAYCVASRADPAAAEARLAADGWTAVEVPAALVGGMNDLKLRQVFLRDAPVAEKGEAQGSAALLMFGDGTMPTGGAQPTRVKMCMAGLLPATGDVRRAMQAELERKPNLKQGQLWVWAYQERRGFRRFLPDLKDATLRRAVREGDLSFLFGGYDAEMEMSGYAVAVDLKEPVP